MTKKRGLFLILLVLAVRLLALPAPVRACSCIVSFNRRPELEFRGADAVFQGTVTGIANLDPRSLTGRILIRYYRYFPPDFNENLLNRATITFEVDAAWKGPAYRTLQLNTGGGCMYPFVKGRTYIVYARALDGRLFTDICMSTKALDRAGKDLDFLAARPAPGLRPAPPSLLTLACLTLVAFISVTAVGGWLWRRHAP